MEFNLFQSTNELYNMSEIDRIAAIAYFITKKNFVCEISLTDIIELLKSHGYSIPNTSRLRQNIKKDKRFSSRGTNFCLTPTTINTFNNILVYNDFTTIESDSEFLDENLFSVGRTYLLKLVKQVNCSYKLNLFDATAVLIRRIFEILLIKSYENYSIENEIKKDGQYVMLEKIVDNAINNKILNLSRSKSDLDNIRNIGNWAAHKIEYNTNKNDLDKIKESYRAITEELLYKSGFKK
mgnify:CR=1 FL=1